MNLIKTIQNFFNVYITWCATLLLTVAVVAASILPGCGTDNGGGKPPSAKAKVTSGDIQIMLVHGLYTETGEYQDGYKSSDNLGRVYSNRTHDGDSDNDPATTKWEKNKQYIDVQVKIIQPAVLPANARIAWEISDPDDPSNEDALVIDDDNRKILDPEDYDGVDNDGDGTVDNSDGKDNSGVRDNPTIYSEYHIDYALIGTETKIKNNISWVRVHVTDDGGDNLIVKATLKIGGTEIAGAVDDTGVMTTWKMLDIDYVRMMSAESLDGLTNGDANEFLEKAYVFIVAHKRDVQNFELPANVNQMGPNELIAYSETEKYVTKADGEFNKEGEGGWFFAAAANHFVHDTVAGATPTLYGPGNADVTAALKFTLPVGQALTDSDIWKIGQKSAALAGAGGNKKMTTDLVFDVADDAKNGSLLYDFDSVTNKFKKNAFIVGHTKGATGAGNGAEITYFPSDGMDAPNGIIAVYKNNVVAVRVTKPGGTAGKTFSVDEWDAATREITVRPVKYSTPKVSGHFSYDLPSHGFAVGSTQEIQVRGAGALVVAGISPGLDDGKTVVFTAAYNTADILAGEHLNTLIHEFGHSLGFHHICGNFDYRSQNGGNGKSCTMHYDYHFNHAKLLDDPPPGTAPNLLPWVFQNGDGYFCAPHVRAIREVNLEDRADLGW